MGALARTPADLAPLIRLARRYRAANRFLWRPWLVSALRRRTRSPSQHPVEFPLARALVTGRDGVRRRGCCQSLASRRLGVFKPSLVKARIDGNLATYRRRSGGGGPGGCQLSRSRSSGRLREAAFHVAADYRLGAFDPEQLYKTNVEGTRNILTGPLARRVVGVLLEDRAVSRRSAYPPIALPGSEETPSTLSDMIGDYKRFEVPRGGGRAGGGTSRPLRSSLSTCRRRSGRAM